VRPLASSLLSAHTQTLLRTAALGNRSPGRPRWPEIEVPGTRITAKGSSTVGRWVACTALGKTQTLETGTLMDLPAGEPYSFKGIEMPRSVDRRHRETLNRQCHL